jgi:hypothetical protein
MVRKPKTPRRIQGVPVPQSAPGNRMGGRRQRLSLAAAAPNKTAGQLRREAIYIARRQMMNMEQTGKQQERAQRGLLLPGAL